LIHNVLDCEIAKEEEVNNSCNNCHCHISSCSNYVLCYLNAGAIPYDEVIFRELGIVGSACSAPENNIA
jgi:hypothetical protein